MTVKIYTYKIVQHPDNVQITQTYFTSKNPGIYEPYDYASVDSFLQKSWRRAYVKGSLIEGTDMQAPTQPYDLFILQSTVSSVTLVWAPASDNVAIGSYQVYQNGSLIATVTADTRSYLAEGLLSGSTSTFYVTAMDTSGNEGPPSNTVSITMPISDFTPPSAPGTLVVGTVTTTSIQLSWTAATDNVKVATYNIYSNGVLFTSTTLLTITVSGLVPNTTYNAYVRAVDTSGNVGPATNTVTPTTLALPDTVAPTIPILNAPVVDSSTQITLSWSASTDAVGVTGYDVYMDGIFNKSVAGNVLTTAMTGLSPSTLYSFYVTAKDAAGNVSAPSNTQTATTSVAADTTAPTAPTLSLTTVGATTVTMQWTASFDAVGVTGYDIYKDSAFLATVSGATLTYQATGLTSNVQYAFYIVAKDAAGNRSPNSNTITATPVDITAPIIGTLSTGTITDTTVVLNWTAATDNVGVTNYLVYKDSVLLTTLGNVLTYTVTGLIVNVSYNFYITARDAAGNVSSGSNVVSPVTVDVIAPTVGTLSTGAITSSSVVLNWTAATDNVAVTGYNIYLDGILQAAIGNILTYTASGLNASTQYSIYIRAKDSAGNLSVNSNTVTPTTSPVSTGRTFYVAKTGNNSNDGLTPQTALLTIVAGLNKATIAGDTVNVLAGVYAEYINVNNNNITLKTTDGAIVDGSTLPGVDWISLINVYGNYNRIEGFEVRHSNERKGKAGGIGIQVHGKNNVISNVYAHHCYSNGIFINGDYNTVEDSRIYYNTTVNENGLSTIGWGDGMGAGRNNTGSALKPGIASFATFRRNIIWNNWGEGVAFFEADSCTMEDNTSYDNWTVNMYISDASNCLVQRNLVYQSSNPAIPLRYSVVPGLVINSEVANGTPQKPWTVNNTLYNNLIYKVGLSAFAWTVAPGGLVNTIIANNTLVDSNLSTGSSSSIVNSNSQIRNNIVVGSYSIPSAAGITFSNQAWTNTGTGSSASDVTTDPKITRTGVVTAGNLTKAYFDIQSTSPCINAGTSINAPIKDVVLVPRPQGAAFDIGAYEKVTNDTQAPIIGTLSTGNITSTTIVLNWTAATDNVAVTNYEVYKGGVLLTTVGNVLTYTATGLIASTQYSFYIKAKDGAGNTSSNSNTVTPTTAPGNTQSTFTNSTSLVIIWNGSGNVYTPYPSPITVSGMSGTVTKVVVKFNNYVAKNYGSINAMVQAPNGTLYSFLVGADTSGTYTITWSMDQASATDFPADTSTVVNNSSYKPFNRHATKTFPNPAPNPGGTVEYTANLAMFNGTGPNGVWNLWAFDGWTSTTNSPVISGGWSITLTTV